MKRKDEKMERKHEELGNRDYITFEWKTENLGVAEFSICPVFKRGRLVEVWIDPCQQENKTLYRLQCNADCFEIGNYSTIEKPPAWIYQYCTVHKTVNMRVYVPKKSTHLTVWLGSTVELMFSEGALS